MHEFSAGILVDVQGGSIPLPASAVQIEVLDRWTSGDGAATYPAAWRLTVPVHAIEVTVRPRVADQEHRGAFRYWEGAASFAGTAAGVPVSGLAYVELTGYAQGESAPR